MEEKKEGKFDQGRIASWKAMYDRVFFAELICFQGCHIFGNIDS